MSTTKRPQALAGLAQSASSTPCGSNEMDASSRTRAQSGAAPDTSMRPNGSPLPPGGPASSIVPASTGSSTKHVRPTNRLWSRIAIRALPSSSLLSCSSSLPLLVVCLRFCPRAPRPITNKPAPSANGPGSSSSVMRRVA
ncbi:hypothetical protein Trihar35433_2361 [Trichoderma harzianum]|nr:hypothetical protein Trihar35433_2361 [Trichoderma harzianum]